MSSSNNSHRYDPQNSKFIELTDRGRDLDAHQRGRSDHRRPKGLNPQDNRYNWSSENSDGYYQATRIPRRAAERRDEELARRDEFYLSDRETLGYEMKGSLENWGYGNQPGYHRPPSQDSFQRRENSLQRQRQEDRERRQDRRAGRSHYRHLAESDADYSDNSHGVPAEYERRRRRERQVAHEARMRDPVERAIGMDRHFTNQDELEAARRIWEDHQRRLRHEARRRRLEG